MIIKNIQCNQSPTDVHFDNLNISHRGGQLLQTNSYYPYGLIIQNLSNTYTNGSNKYLFKSKELILNNDLKEYDYGARLYDPTLCRWKAQDPADQYFTPYAAFGNNPANLIDPDGRQTRQAQSSLMNALVSVVNMATMPARYLSAATSQLEDKLNGTKRQGSYYKSEYITKGASPYNRVHGVSYNSPSAFYDGEIILISDGLTRVSSSQTPYFNPSLIDLKNPLDDIILPFITKEVTLKAKPEIVERRDGDYPSHFYSAVGDNSNFYLPEEEKNNTTPEAPKNNIIYQRTTETNESTTGTFTIPGTSINGYILEPSGPSTTESNLDKRIPAGTYNLIPNVGQKYGLRLFNKNVSKGRAILIHVGNYPGDTEGCLLPGSSVGKNSVGGSGDMIKKIMKHFTKVGFKGATITITDINK